MEIRKSNVNDVQAIMKLVHQAQSYFKNNDIDQWQDGYPNADNILSDINNRHSYVLLQDNIIIGTMYFAFEEDPCYKTIYGKWLTHNQPYAVIHRIVVDENYKGQNYAKELLNYAITECHKHNITSIRIDTHHDNQSMQRFLQKSGFQPCGQITLESGSLRVGFEKTLNK